MCDKNIFSEKNILEKNLGLPPMQLAESVTLRGSNPNTISKCSYTWLKKLVVTVILTSIAAGTYVVFLNVLQNGHTTEIIVVNMHDRRNVTIKNDNLQFQNLLKNKASDSALRRKKRYALHKVAKITQENFPTYNNDEEVAQVRKIIINHDVLPCNDGNKNEICKQIVTKLKRVTKDIKEKYDSNNIHSIPTVATLLHTTTYGDDGEFDHNSENSGSLNSMSTKKDKYNKQVTRAENDDEFQHTYALTHPVIPKTVENYRYTPQQYPEAYHSPSPQLLPPLADTCLLARLLKNNQHHLHAIYDVPTAYGVPQYPSFVQESIAPASYSNYFPEPNQYPPQRLVEPIAQDYPPHPQDIEISMRVHSTTPAPGSERDNESLSRESECSSGTISCADNQKCIPTDQWCNGIVNCADVSDESRCNCDTRIDKFRLCDGYFDCPFGEDEMGCYGCGPDAFSCEDLDLNSRSTCFTKEQRCDNIANCPNRKDETDCNLLSFTLHELPAFAVSNTEGFLQRNFKGTWYPVCLNPYMWAHDACRRETGLIIRPPFIQVIPVDPLLKLTYLNTTPSRTIAMSDTCFNSSAVYVTCPDLLCGTRVLTTPQLLRENNDFENRLYGRNKRFLTKNVNYPLIYNNKRLKRLADNMTFTENVKISDDDITHMIGFVELKDEGRNKRGVIRGIRAESRVVGGKPSQPAAWPWMVAMYRDGKFHCGGVVITARWIMSAAHCLEKFWEHYYEIQVGMLRRFSFSPQEHSLQVSHIIVNRKYNRADMNNDLSLLRVKQPIQFSRWVRPICLPNSDTAGPEWMWGPPPGTICTAVGWGATFEHGPDPDHIREVEVPIWSQCNHKEDKAGHEICAGLLEGGKDACQGDSGGPLLCRNPLNSQQWYMAGIVSHGNGCGRKGDPGVYTRVSMYVQWIKHHISARTLPSVQPKQECPGFKCSSGVEKCLPKTKYCDKIVDCLEGEDESNCNYDPNSKDSETNLFLKKPFNEFNSIASKDAESDSNEKSQENSNMSDSSEEKKHTQDLHTQNHNNKESTVTETVDTNNLTTEKEPTSHISTAHITSENNIEITTPKPLNEIQDEITDKTTSTDNTFIELVTRGDVATNSEEMLKSTLNDDEDNFSGLAREADVTEDWAKFDSTTQNTPTISSNFTSVSVNDGLELTTSSIESVSDFPENKSNFINTININNKTKESKEFPVHILVNISNETHNESASNKKKTNNNITISNSTVPFVNHNSVLKNDADSNKTIPIHIITHNDEKEGKNIVDTIHNIVKTNIHPADIKVKHDIPEKFQCQRMFQEIPFIWRCNHKADCEDGTDEIGCTCVDYITTFDQKLLCDGIIDCANGEDEHNCFSCPEKTFLCKKSKTCLSLEFVCDDKIDCPEGEDELDCYALTNGKTIELDGDDKPEINLEGFLTKKRGKNWTVICEDNLTSEQQEQAAGHVCRYLGFSSANRLLVKYINVNEANIKTINDDVRSKRNSKIPLDFIYREANLNSHQPRQVKIDDPQIIKPECLPNITKTCMSLYVFCERTLFDNLLHFEVEESELERSESRENNRVWPWIAKVYVEGYYKCTGILIDVSWILVNQDCLWDSWLTHHYVSVVLGTQRPLKSTQGPYEQIYQVDARKRWINSKVTLLHLSEPAYYTHIVKPMAVSVFTHDGEKNAICVAIGVDNNNNTISVFLEETHVNCKFPDRCFKRLQKRPVCHSGTLSIQHWAGVISCHGSQGWHPSASFVEPHGECSVGHIIIATDIGNLRSEIKPYLGSFQINSTSNVEDLCDGTRCRRGRCIRFGELCNGVRDCEDGADESDDACQKKNRVCGDDPHHGGCECKTGEMKCKNGRCVSKELYGNGKDDCGDVSDEPNSVVCSHYLARTMPSRLCDGIVHCHDKSDEDPIFCKCFSKKSLPCGASDHCVSPDVVCDGNPDCPQGEDEHTCLALTTPEGTHYTPGTGVVIARSHGVWHTKCYPKKEHTSTELEFICRKLGFLSGHARQLKQSPHVAAMPQFNVELDDFTQIKLNPNTTVKLRNKDEPLARQVIASSKDENCFPVFIECI